MRRALQAVLVIVLAALLACGCGSGGQRVAAALHKHPRFAGGPDPKLLGSEGLTYGETLAFEKGQVRAFKSEYAGATTGHLEAINFEVSAVSGVKSLQVAVLNGTHVSESPESVVVEREVSEAEYTAHPLKANELYSVSVPTTSLTPGDFYWIAILPIGGAIEVKYTTSATNVFEEETRTKSGAEFAKVSSVTEWKVFGELAAHVTGTGTIEGGGGGSEGQEVILP